MSQTATLPRTLSTGEHMDWDEFEARWNELPEVRFAELIDGIVRMPSPLSNNHAHTDALIAYWLGTYFRHTPGVWPLQNPTVRLDARNAPQPDAVLLIDRRPVAERGLIRPIEYAEPPIELVVEVSVTSGVRDTEVRRALYHRFGVREYVIWRVSDGAVDWLARREGGYEPLAADAAGVVRSEVFPGLWLDTPGLLRGDPNALATAVEAGCVTPEHAAFVERLRAEFGG